MSIPGVSRGEERRGVIASLAPQPLRYRETAPITALAGYVQSIWQLEGECREASPRRIVPDGCMSLVVNFGAPLEQVFEVGTAAWRARSLLIGEVRRPLVIQARGRVELLGVRFWPGAIGKFVVAPLAEIVDGLADESAFRTALARRISRTVCGAERADRLRLVQTALVEELTGAPECDGLTREAALALLRSEGRIKIDGLAVALGVSRRTLERRFAVDVGIPAKSLASVLRFRRVLKAFETSAVAWTDLAMDCGYYDQSHLIRDFKRFTGRAPRAYLLEAPSLSSLRIASTER